jgi:hypothetical protein
MINQPANHTKTNSEYYTAKVLGPLYEGFFPRGLVRRAKHLVDVDTCAVATTTATELFMADHEMLSLRHAPCSPDLAPSDFYLFGTVKNCLEQIQASDGEDPFAHQYEILLSVSIDEFERVFAAWIERVRQASQGTGGYIRKYIIYHVQFVLMDHSCLWGMYFLTRRYILGFRLLGGFAPSIMDNGTSMKNLIA